MPRVTLTVNDRPWAAELPAGTTLLEALRDHLRLTGTKYGCGEGQCGSCTVLADGRAVRACITPVPPTGTIVTVEGLAEGERLHPVQQAFIDAQAFQCGFCTPGMIVGSVALLTRTTRPSDAEIAQALDGHLCRCGTYPRVVQAVRAAGQAMTRGDRHG